MWRWSQQRHAAPGRRNTQACASHGLEWITCDRRRVGQGHGYLYSLLRVCVHKLSVDRPPADAYYLCSKTFMHACPGTAGGGVPTSTCASVPSDAVRVLCGGGPPPAGARGELATWAVPRCCQRRHWQACLPCSCARLWRRKFASAQFGYMAPGTGRAVQVQFDGGILVFAKCWHSVSGSAGTLFKNLERTQMKMR